MKKVLHFVAAFALAAVASAASAQQTLNISRTAPASVYGNPAAPGQMIHITVSTNQPVVVGPLFSPQPTSSANYPEPGFSYTSMSANGPKKRLPDVKISNRHYNIDCFEKTKGVCDKVAAALEQADYK